MKQLGNIYGKSLHPVAVKKINLVCWTLRHELEAKIQERVVEEVLKQEDQEKPPEFEKINLDDLREEYTKKYIPEKSEDNQIKEAKENEEESQEGLDDTEDEMAKALAEVEAEEEKKEEPPTDNPDTKEAKTEGEEAPSEEKKEGDLLKFPEAEAGAEESHVVRTLPNLNEEDIAHGMILLGDINLDDIVYFSSHSYIPGTSIVIKFLVPTSFSMSAEVLMCSNYNSESKIISPTRPKFRVHARFTFSRAGEKTTLREFINSYTPELPVFEDLGEAEDEKDGDDSLDDLDDLGL